MRTIAPLCAFGLVCLGIVGCSDNTLSSIPPDPEAEVVVTDIPPLPTPQPTPQEPVADAGPDRIYATGDQIQLDGTGSYDPDDNDPLVYAWTLVSWPDGASVQVSSLDDASPTFVADVEGDYAFELTVMNTIGLWDATPASVIVSAQDDPVFEPVADAGSDQTVDNGDTVQLDGTASFDPQGLEPLTYAWQIVQRPTGSTVTVAGNASATPSFIVDHSGTFVLELTVQNSAGIWDSTADPVTVQANEVILPPVADAGIDRTAEVGTPVELDGRASTDPQGLTPLSYAWTITERPPGSNATLTGASGERPVLIPDVDGFYSVDLTVGNTAGYWDQTPDGVDIIANAVAIEEPVADAGADFGVLPLEMVQLDGTASYDPAGLEPLTWSWQLVTRPQGSTADLSEFAVDRPGFFADLAGIYEFELTVQNSAGVWDSSPDRVIVEALPIDGFYVEVTWDAENDLDLHVLQGGAALWSEGDVNYCNLNPDWGATGALDDPSLDADAIDGFGPETTTIASPAPGSYEVAVHYYGVSGSSDCGAFSCPVTTATVRIYIGGILAETFSRQLDDQGQVWTAARIDVPSGLITPIDLMGSTAETYCD